MNKESLNQANNETREQERVVRWEQYQEANIRFPKARENEVREMVAWADPAKGDTIWEMGTGSGILTFPLAEKVGSTGEVITTDVNETNTRRVQGIMKAMQKEQKVQLPIKPMLLTREHNFLEGEEWKDYFDKITNLAAFHHFDNRLEGTGESGRIRALKVFHENLKEGGTLSIGDVLQGTMAQRYFDAIDNPTHLYPDGHPHDFPTQERVREMAEQAGFKNTAMEVKYVPWQFDSEKDAMEFVHTLHNARCSPEESLDAAKKYLGLKKVDDRYELGWELFYLKAQK